MAKQKTIEKALQEGRLDLEYFADHCLDMIFRKFNIWGVYPNGFPGPYPGFRELNEERKRNNTKAWYSEGKSATVQEIYARVYSGAGGNTERIAFFFNKYLQFADMGVGAGRKIGNVTERATAAKWNQVTAPFKWGRPIEQWTAEEKKRRQPGTNSRRSRPTIKMELRHQARRLQTLASSFYGRFMEINMLYDEERSYAPGQPAELRFVKDEGGVVVTFKPGNKIQ